MLFKNLFEKIIDFVTADIGGFFLIMPLKLFSFQKCFNYDVFLWVSTFFT